MQKTTSSFSKPIALATIFLTTIWILVTCLLVRSIMGVHKYQEDTSNLFDNYVMYSSAATALSRDFNIRSDNVKSYVATGEQLYIDKYFEEETLFANQHGLLSQIRATSDIEQYMEQLDKILANSSALSSIEYHTMKLAAVAYGNGDDTVPEIIRKYQLSDEEEALDSIGKADAAIALLFGNEYTSLRVETLQLVGQFIDNIIDDTTRKYETSKSILTDFIHNEQNILITDALILVALIILVARMTYLRKKHDKQLINSMAINSTFASTYNSVILINPQTRSVVIHSSSSNFPSDLEEAATTGYNDYAHYFINKIAYPDDASMLIKKCSLDTICKELEGKKSYVVTYRVRSLADPSVPVYFRSEFLPFTDSKGNMMILCGGTVADTEIRASLKNEMNEALVESLATLVENRDLNTGNHIQHTRQYVSFIVHELRRQDIYPDILSKSYADTVISGSVLHDVGKIYISDTILNKPGKLTTDEFDIMKKHPEYGSKVIENTLISSLDEESHQVISDLVLHHHERWDGKGYPSGLKGDEIPLSARIMAVADVFDALVSRRSYKEPFTVDKAFAILEEEKGTHFDGRIVDIFVKIRPMIENFLKEESN